MSDDAPDDPLFAQDCCVAQALAKMAATTWHEYFSWRPD
jgi:hypothetical protein